MRMCVCVCQCTGREKLKEESRGREVRGCERGRERDVRVRQQAIRLLLHVHGDAVMDADQREKTAVLQACASMSAKYVYGGASQIVSSGFA